MKYILLVILILSCGCLATSRHVDKGDILLLKVANEANVTPSLKAEIKTHVKEGSAPQLPDTSGTPLESLLGGAGGIVGILYAGYKHLQKNQSDKKAIASRELAVKLAMMEKSESMKELEKA